MSDKRIIYPTDDGGVAILIPAPDWLIQEGNSLEELAAKDVPAGKPYKIVNVSDIPSDRTFRAAWSADFTNPDGYGIGADAWFAKQAAKGG